ncbi:hypothetical protein HAX54_050678 [Datura stramonium]|uniref:caffeoyl-CoA O-methyltransferase n=1 Tax=Datura stramonium TaxID=4076 RepID=A0ABS8RT92_DATST|nr:hypothetical protein [Datura stramonium]
MASSKGLLQSRELHEYVLKTAVYPREPEFLKEIREITATHPLSIMGTAPEAGQLIALLLKLANAKKTMEIGVFTGYSLLLTALTIPQDGKHENRGSFDFAFVDADKVNYQKYHERMLHLVKVGGIIVYDNTLWFGTVAMPEDSVEEDMKPNRAHIIEFNKFLATDNRFQISQLPLGDGITICRKL